MKTTNLTDERLYSITEALNTRENSKKARFCHYTKSKVTEKVHIDRCDQARFSRIERRKKYA